MPRNSPEKLMFFKQIGKRIKELRVANGMSRKELGKKIGISHQQVTKYEMGENSICLHKLYMISTICDFPLKGFIDGYDEPDTITPRTRYKILVHRLLDDLNEDKQRLVFQLIQALKA